MYLVTRRDLTPGYQAVQSVHALRKFIEDHPQIDQAWYNQSNYLSLLSVADEQSLHNLIFKLQQRNIAYSVFTEPDIDNQITAIAIEPGDISRKLVSNLPTALKEYQSNNIDKHNFNHE